MLHRKRQAKYNLIPENLRQQFPCCQTALILLAPGTLKSIALAIERRNFAGDADRRQC